MRSAFGARRQARKVGQEEDEEVEDARPELASHDKGKKCTHSLSAQISNVSM